MRTKYVNGRVYNYDFTHGCSGVGGKNFFYPCDFALGPQGNMYVLSKGMEWFPSQGITKCNLDHEFFWEDRGRKFMDGQAPQPSSIAVDSEENVYVSEEMTNHIFIFDKDGNRLGSWGSGREAYGLHTPDRGSNDVVLSSLPVEDDRPSSALMPLANNFTMPFELYLKKVGAMDTSGDGELNGPNGLTFDEDDRLFISDSHNHRIQVFTKDGQFISKFGQYGSEEGELNLPWGIALDKDHNVYVADWGNSRVQKFSDDGRHLATFGGPESGKGRLYRPSSVAVDSEGDVYVTDYDAHRLVVYEPNGDYLVSFDGDSEQLSPWVMERYAINADAAKARKRADLSVERYFKWPVTVNVDDEGRIIVLEAVSARIQVYMKEQDWTDPPENL